MLIDSDENIIQHICEVERSIPLTSPGSTEVSLPLFLPWFSVGKQVSASVPESFQQSLSTFGTLAGLFVVGGSHLDRGLRD